MKYSVENNILLKDGNPVSWKKSPNYSRHDDGSPVIMNPELVVIHYTASDGLQGTLDWLCKSQGKKSVSAHLVVAKNGIIWQLLPLNYVGWHAGNSEWDGREWCNNFSIGIENMGWGRKDDWPDAQIESNIGILKALHEAYPIIGIAGHEDISRTGKVDPGPYFPWARIWDGLREAGIEYE